MKKKMVFLLSLLIVSFVTFASATYAYFSEQLHPRVDNLIFNVATQENVMVSTSGVKGTFKDSISFNEMIGDNEVTLKPLLGTVGDNYISLFDGSNTATDGYISFSLYFSASDDKDLYLAGSISGTVIDIVDESSIFTNEQKNKIVKSLRVGFVSYTTVETPTSSGIEISYAPINTEVYATEIKDNSSYKGGLLKYETFNNLGYTGSSDDVLLLDLYANKISKMDVFVWLESDDVNCDISIFDCKLRVNVRFEAIDREGDDS